MRQRLASILLIATICHPAALPAAAADAPRSTLALNPLSKLDPASFKAFVERPLFSPDRRAPQPQKDDEATSEAVVDAFDIKLLGIIVTPEGAVARIKDNSDGTFHSLSAGDVFNEWHVDLIKADALIMSKSGEIRTYDLFAVQVQMDKAGAPTTNIRSNISNSSSESNRSDTCTDVGSNCDLRQHSQQDLIDFFGPKAK